MRAILVGVGGFGREWWSCLTDRQVEVVALVEPSDDDRGSARGYFEVDPAATFADDTAPWWEVDTDFVLDCSPPDFRIPHARSVMDQGVDMLVAKPMATNLADARELYRMARATDTRLAVAQQMRFLGAFEEIRTVRAEGSLGQLGVVTMEFNVDGRLWRPGMQWRSRMEHPVLLEGSVHVFDLLRWITGDEPVAVVAHAFNPPWSPFRGAAGLTADVELRSGCVARYRANWAPRGSRLVTLSSGWQLEFEHGMVELADEAVLVNGVVHRPAPASPTPLAVLNGRLLDWYLRHLDGGTDDGPTGADNLRTMALVDAVRRSADDGVRVGLP